MSPVLFGWSSETQDCGTPDPVWDGVQNSTLDPSLQQALDWFSLPPTSAALEDATDLSLLQHGFNGHAQAQPSGADSAWNIPSTSPLETARSAPDETQAATTTSDSFLDLVSPSEEGHRQAGGTQSRYTTERKLLKNREAQEALSSAAQGVLDSLLCPLIPAATFPAKQKLYWSTLNA